ncbi:MAG: ATP-dependent RNA helicase DbpA [Gammaproteobacteria bacterium]|nr:ATP-dependent RNA helicase DbpA [Gammaproteobacteria bacterium]
MKPADFSSLKLNPSLISNLDSLGYQSMMPIQAESLPPILAGKDVIAQGKTGSGKTAAFGLGLLNKLEVKRFRIQALLLCPTRELADQVAVEIRRLARSIHNIKVLTLCGGKPFGPQVGSLEHGAHIIVGTPGRVEDHLRRGTLKLSHVDTLVLDEADRMLDMGFQESLDFIIEQIPEERQTLLFSATYPERIRSIAERIMHDPLMVKVEGSHDNETIAQTFYPVAEDADRLDALHLLLQLHRPPSALVFCNTRKEVQEVANALNRLGFSALALHGELEQRDRDQALVRFANKSISILVATDVAARGLDIEALDAVFNYHLAHEQEVHLHRVGRTGRAGGKGMAATIYSEAEAYRIAALEVYLDRNVERAELPDVALLQAEAYPAEMVCLQIDGGKKQKVRPGDILGALTAGKGIEGSAVGKIHLFPLWAYVAVKREVANTALKKLSTGKLKGRSFRVRQIGH